MKRYGWLMGLLVITVALAVVPMSASAQCGGGQMDHSTMGSDHMGYSDHRGSSGHKGSSAHKGSGHKVAEHKGGHKEAGHKGSEHMGRSSQTATGHTGNYGYADPNTVSATPPAAAWVPAPSGQATGPPAPSEPDHNH